MRFLVAHAAWDPRRRASLERLLGQLGPVCNGVIVESRGREHAAIWSRRVWEAAARHDDYTLILNDDVVLLPGFRERLDELVAAVPDEPISLHCTNPLAVPLAAAGHAWVRGYHYTGPAVVLPPGAAESLLRFVYRLPWSLLSRVNEDVIASMWAWDRQRPFWYTLPAPVTHDTSVPSTLGYDDHPNRTPVVLPEPGAPWPDPTVRDRWAVPFVELSWLPSGGLERARQVVRAGRHLCTMCVAREGVVGRRKDPAMVCLRCLAEMAQVADMAEERP